MTPGQLSALLSRQAAEIPTRIAGALEECAALVQERAEYKIGNLQPDWKPLAETTIEGWHGYEGKRDMGFPPPDFSPLLRTGQMARSFGHDVQGLTATIGNTDPKSQFHEYGTSRAPPRPFLSTALSELEQDVVDRIGAAVFVAQ